MDRNIAPHFGDIQMPVLPAVTTSTLENGVQMHVLRGGNLPIVKVDVLVRACPLRSDKPGVANMVTELLGQGTANHDAKELANILDFYGAYLSSGKASNDSTVITLQCLRRDLGNLLPIFEEIVKQPSFPQDEIDISVASKLQDLEVNKLKTSYNASKQMLKALYADGDRNARFLKREDLLAMTPQLLTEFHRMTYRPAGALVFVTGLPTDDDLRMVSDAFGKNWEGGELWTEPAPVFRNEVCRKYINFEGKQTSFRMVRKTIDRRHPDFWPLQVAISIFGGNSLTCRLMQTLREKLGLTYGIYAFMPASRFDSFMSISSELKTGSEQKALEVIGQEMQRMATELVTDNELDGIRGVMLGDLLQQFDSVMTSASTILTCIASNVAPSEIVDSYNVIKSITPEEVRDVAARWFQPDKFHTICVGPGVSE